MPSFRSKLNRIAKMQIRLAGPRYSPGLDPKAPNIEIDALLLTLDSLACDQRFAAEIRSLSQDLKKDLEYNATARELFAKRRLSPERLIQALLALQNASPTDANVRLSAVQKIAKSIGRRLTQHQANLSAKGASAQDEDQRQRLRGQESDILRLISPVRAVMDFCESSSCRLLSLNRLLILGEWGTGKTHFLCDVTRQRMARRQPTLFVLAQHLPLHVEPLQAICQATRLAKNAVTLLRYMDRAGQAAGRRALIIVDAINEGDRDAWHDSLPSLTRLVRQYPHVGLVLSCRRPFNQQLFTRATAAEWVTVEHTGFTNVEFDAQLEFFSFYDIPAPQTPLLTEEFSRPLFLKILCETIRNLSQKGKKAYLKSLASGQKGMTKALEDFVKHVGSRAEQDLGLPNGFCWRLLKGHTVNSAVVGITPTMADDARDYVTRAEALTAIRTLTECPSMADAERILHRLVTDGLLMETSRWSTADQLPVDVIGLPYQRFSDHLIARHLLKNLNTTSISAIQRSFYRDRPLGKVFEVGGGGHSFVMPGIASAIMLEFPERIKNRVARDERELVFFLPRKRRLHSPVRSAFLSGLHWRSIDSFGKDTFHLINVFLTHAAEYERWEVLETLIELATRPAHPLSAERLMGFLLRMKMPDRDLLWSEFLRHTGNESIVMRLIKWIDRTAGRPLDHQAADRMIVLLSLFLTTTRKTLRDQATRALVLVGLQTPEALFAHVERSFAFDDPYVPERVLAAAYGVAMNGWADPRHRSVQRALPRLARRVVAQMFTPNAPHATRHTLMRDYALGIIELGRRIDPKSVGRREAKWLREPFAQLPEGFPAPDSIADADAEALKDTLRMDFENYTIGRLVSDRRNYDAEHPGYKNVRKQILWRAGQLGYSASRFEEVDQRIAHAASYTRRQEPDRVERYGKKYTWIGYFEMYGLQQDRGAISPWRLGDRCSDVDIDPSFPTVANKWRPPLPDLFSHAPKPLAKWIRLGPTPDYTELYRRRSVGGVRGAWVLVDGYIQQGTPDKRQIFTFLRGLFVTKSNLQKLQRTLLDTQYPGNSSVPELGSDHYTFAGEIPWSPRFAASLRTKKGRARRAIDTAFARYVNGAWNGISVEMGAWQFAWESYHSTTNTESGATVLAPRLAEQLALVNHDRSWDMFERSGRQATVYVEWRERDEFHSSHLFYVRRDLLRKYLEQTRQQLVMIPWGERTVHYSILNNRESEFAEVFQKHYHIHKTFHEIET